MDWRTEEFQARLDKTARVISDSLELHLRDKYEDSLNYDEIFYIAEEISSELTAKITQVIRKGMP